jgi:UDP-glucose 4-epimerase
VRVGVTGGAGFIGRATCRSLFDAGHEPLVLDRASGWNVMHDPLPACDAVIHLAGVLGTHELFDRPQTAVDVNVSGTLRVLEACREQGARYVGITMPPVFESIYTATKVCATRLASAYHHSFGVPVSHVRAFNAYGPGQAHGPGHPQKILPTFATEAWAGRPLPIWGDGEQTVDLVHVDDLGRMLAQAVDFGDDETFDGGTGRPLTVNQVAREVLLAASSSAGTMHLPMRRGETPTRIAAAGEGWDRLGWQPTFDVQRLREAVESYRPAAVAAA